jgi:hypothetical protein
VPQRDDRIDAHRTNRRHQTAEAIAGAPNDANAPAPVTWRKSLRVSLCDMRRL